MASVIDRGNGTYQARCSFGRKPDGKPKQKTTTYHHESGISSPEAEAAAQRFADDWERALKGGRKYDPTLTVSELHDLYVKFGQTRKDGQKIAESTAYSYEQNYKNYIKGYFGSKKAIDITNTDITNYIETLVDDLSCGSRKKIITVLGAYYTFAVSKGYLLNNPVRNVTNPADEETDEQWTMQLPQAQRFIAFLAKSDVNDDVRRILTFLSLTGLRISECLGLSWDDVDLDIGTMHIRHSLTATNGLHLTKPKNKFSKRTLILGEESVRILREQREYCDILGASLKTYAHPEMVFPSALGNYRDRHSVYISLTRMVRGTEFEFLTLHKLRHVCATIMLGSGAEIATVSRMLGHSSIDTTYQIYAEVIDELKAVASTNVEKLLIGENNDLVSKQADEEDNNKPRK